jgi:hypothetical protein
MTPTMIFAISAFTYWAALGLLMSIVWSLKTDNGYKMLSMSSGFDMKETAATSEQTGKAMKYLLLDFTSQMMGMNMLALLIIWIPFRNGELWAWGALWFYPIMFCWHHFLHAKGTKFSIVQIVYCVLSALALILSYSNFN